MKFKFYTSYFYQIRFFQPNMIPLSTACGDPKWYHDFKSKDHCFVDKRGVMNGLRAEMLHPGPLCAGTCDGGKKIDCGKDPSKCSFLKIYEFQLAGVDWENFLVRCHHTAEAVRQWNGYEGEPVFVLMVHEAWYNPCSERVTLQNWVKSHGYECTELPYINGKFVSLQ